MGNYSNFDFFVDSLWVQSQGQDLYPTQLPAGQYVVWVVASNGVCGRRSLTLPIEVFASPTLQISPDTIIVEGSFAQLYASGGDFYQWSPDNDLNCSTCPTTMASPSETTTYSLRIENIEGCVSTDTVLVQVKADAEQILFIPNVITPNGDGKNDTWRIENIELFPKNKVIIVNRWGDIVYQSEYYNNSWDGTFSGGMLPAGTYYYILELGGSWGQFKGPITIIRK